MCSRRRIRRTSVNDSGQVMVGFAIVLPLMALLIFGAASLGKRISDQPSVSLVLDALIESPEMRPYLVEVPGITPRQAAFDVNTNDGSLGKPLAIQNQITTALVSRSDIVAASALGQMMTVEIYDRRDLSSPLTNAVYLNIGAPGNFKCQIASNTVGNHTSLAAYFKNEGTWDQVAPRQRNDLKNLCLSAYPAGTEVPCGTLVMGENFDPRIVCLAVAAEQKTGLGSATAVEKATLILPEARKLWVDTHTTLGGTGSAAFMQMD